MDETKLLAAILRERKHYETALRIGLDPAVFSDGGRAVFDFVGQQYQRDKALQAVDEDILRAQAERRYPDADMVASIMDYVASLPAEVSGVNVLDEYRLARLRQSGMELATRIAGGRPDEEIEKALAVYQSLREGSGKDAERRGRLSAEDFEESGAQRIPVDPSSLNKWLNGGPRRGHSIVVIGRPDSGKSMFALCNAAYWCAAGYKVLYVANEEPAQDITRRLLSRLRLAPLRALESPRDVARALKEAGEAYENWHLFHEPGATVSDVKAYAAEIDPAIIVIDQLKNLKVNEDNRALQLDKVAREIRELGIDRNCVTMSVTQAGESGHNKLNLGMGDVEWSNTGIPGAADLGIGIGVNEQYSLENKRMISIWKNKVSGKHGAFPVFVDPETTRFMSSRRGQ